jgi:hypothetical protein
VVQYIVVCTRAQEVVAAPEASKQLWQASSIERW